MFTQFHLGDSIVDPLRLTKEQFKPLDVASALANINRYSGNGRFKINVAQHSVILSQHVPAHLKMAALTHDVPEVFVGDVNGPILTMLGPRITDFQNEILRNLAPIVGISYADYLELTPFDKRISTDEREAIFPNHAAWKTEHTLKGLGARFDDWSSAYSAHAWLSAFYEGLTLQRWQTDDVTGADVAESLRGSGSNIRGPEV